MAVSAASGCVTLLQQQWQQTEREQQQGCHPVDGDCPPRSKNCTIVENGRVVVKPLSDPPDRS